MDTQPPNAVLDVLITPPPPPHPPHSVSPTGLCESKFTRVSNGIKPPRTALKGQGYLRAMQWIWKLLRICGFAGPE